MFSEQKYDSQQDVAAIVTAMTDSEEPFVRDTLEAVFSDPGIGQVVLCIEEKNTWLNTAIGQLSMEPRLEIIRLPLIPLGAVRNQALTYVTLPWVAYCDGDDVWCQGKTLIQRTYVKKTECDFVGADHYLTSADGKIRAVASARYLPMPSSWMVRTEVMRQHPFSELPFSLSQEESGEWWRRTSTLVSKTRCPKLLLRYRIRTNSLSMNTLSMQGKTKIVNLANIPVLGTIIFFASWCIWLSRRKTEYIWQQDWGKQHNTSTDVEMGDITLLSS
jgi:hypothetical protein